MKLSSIFTLLLCVVFTYIALIISGCDSQKSFKPQGVSGEITFDKKLDSPIISTNYVSAKLKNDYIITHNSAMLVKLKKEENLLYIDSKYWIIADGCKGVRILPLDTESKKPAESSKSSLNSKRDTKEITIPTTSCVASASIKDNYVAGLLSDNTAFLYDLDSKKFIFKDKGEGVYAISSNNANPVFMDTLVIFPTLDGRLNTLDLKTLKSVRNIIVSTEKFLNNIVFLSVKQDEIVAATQKRIYTLIKGDSYNKDLEIRDLYVDANFIYALSLNGVIYKLDKMLNEVKSVKLPYSKLNGIFIKNGRFYTFDNSGGFIISLDLESFAYDVYKLQFGSQKMKRWFSKKSSIFYVDNVLYINDRVLDFNKDLATNIQKTESKNPKPQAPKTPTPLQK